MFKVETDLFGGFVGLLRVERRFAPLALAEFACGFPMAADSVGAFDPGRSFGVVCRVRR